MISERRQQIAVRGDLTFREHYELLVEGRLLDMADLDERRSGALVTVSRYLGDHLKIGLGYNFTDFSDDLTDLSYDHHGIDVTEKNRVGIIYR